MKKDSIVVRRKCSISIALVIMSLLPAVGFAQTYDKLLKEVDALVSFVDTDLSAEYLIETRDPRGSASATRATMFRRDRTSQYLILVLEPEIDKGKGYLKQGETLWLYDPVGKTFNFTSAKDRFENSGARNSDFSRSSYSDDYRAVSASKQKLGAYSCDVIELEAKNDGVSFPKVKIWVSDDKLVRKIEDYSLSGRLMRTTAIAAYQKIGERRLPAKMVILDHLKYRTVDGKTDFERTTVTITKPSLAPLPDIVYTKEYLQKVAR